ncbi:PREDICTED: pheromone-binding protein Gp-9-like isoform X1 [Atta colombica]|uniref:pheromone-binding protein Gp-9-like isoform X1 n=1 Tax=Atta colombica TaxID=520822 RepID=UPI00084C0834|nr:PREDICTED: pheromone-binding protein Gp-9-like isoform X1 [Atta colombica]
MKSLMLYTYILIIAFQPSSSRELKKFKNLIETIEDDIEFCKNKNNVTDADIYNREEIITDLPIQPENEERKRRVGCWIACILKRQNLMEGSNIKEAQVYVIINMEYTNSSQQVIVYRVARKCMKQVRNITQECEKSFFLLACFVKTGYEEQKHQELEIKEAEEKA